METNTTSKINSNTRPFYRGTRVVWYLASLLEALLAFRFVLKLLGANQVAGFTQFIYGVTSPFVAPFVSVFKITKVVAGSVFEWTTLLAILVYWLIAWAIIKLIVVIKPTSGDEAAEKLRRED